MPSGALVPSWTLCIPIRILPRAPILDITGIAHHARLARVPQHVVLRVGREGRSRPTPRGRLPTLARGAAGDPRTAE